MSKMTALNCKPIDVFLAVSLGITSLFIVLNVFMDGVLFEKCVLSSTFLFSDYFYHIAGSSDTSIMYSYGDPYSFPPFAYLMYSLLWSLNPYKDRESILNWQNYREADNALVVFVVYSMLSMMLLLYCISQYFRGGYRAKYSILLPTALLVSYPFMCTSVQRGNVVIVAALFLALAWLWMDSESWIKQELALLFIAFCAGFKLYPALLGVVYLKRKEWKKAGRLMIYGLVVVFVPFLFFAVSLFCFFLSRRKWQEALFLSGILVSFLPSNWEYTLVYYLPPLFLFMKEYDRDFRRNSLRTNIWIFLHTVGFGMVFSVDFLMLYYRYGLISGIFTITYVMIGANMLCVLWERLNLIRKSHNPLLL